jgi:hypothetical protein
MIFVIFSKFWTRKVKKNKKDGFMVFLSCANSTQKVKKGKRAIPELAFYSHHGLFKRLSPDFLDMTSGIYKELPQKKISPLRVVPGT